METTFYIEITSKHIDSPQIDPDLLNEIVKTVIVKMMYSWEEEVVEGWAEDSYGNKSASFNGTDFDFDDDDLDRLDPEARNELETLLFAQIHFAPAVEAESGVTAGQDDRGTDPLVKEADEALAKSKNCSFLPQNYEKNEVSLVAELGTGKEPRKEFLSKKRKSDNFEDLESSKDGDVEEGVPVKKKKKKKDASAMETADPEVVVIDSSEDDRKKPAKSAKFSLSKLLKTRQSLETILAAIPEDESWGVDFRDALPSFRRPARYFAPFSALDSISCFNCGKKGHLSKYCEAPKRFNVCYNCGRRDHQVQLI